MKGRPSESPILGRRNEEQLVDPFIGACGRKNGAEDCEALSGPGLPPSAVPPFVSHVPPYAYASALPLLESATFTHLYIKLCISCTNLSSYKRRYK